MKNLIAAIETQEKSRLQEFINGVNAVADFAALDTWQYNKLLPKGKSIKSYMSAGDVAGHFEAVKAYLIGRKEKKVYKEIEKEVKGIQTVAAAGELISVKISVEWKRSKMWGSNPTAEAWASFKNKDGHTDSVYVTSGSISGCGYDKLSTAVARCLNQINEVLKPLYLAKDKALKADKKADNRQILGYGAGYGVLPHIEGGVGCSCYPAIFEKIGFNFQSVASGKTFDVYTITKA